MTRLEKPLQRAPSIGANPSTSTVDPDRFDQIEKERRKGMPQAWAELGDDDAGLAAALQASAAERPR
ncbi:MAG TPA: hypothetical protein VK325_04835 [Pseudoxanthomonas sp.]|nr:hypothetical protein [Pseudoxanthomonas sp.]